MEDKRVFLTRDTVRVNVEVWPVTVGIRKFRGCVVYGAAWNKENNSSMLFPTGHTMAEDLGRSECRKRFGFYPSKGTAWYISESGKRTKVDLDFSD